MFLLCSPEHRGVQLRFNLHGHQLLQEQFARIWHVYQIDFLAGGTKFAVVSFFSEDGLAEQAAGVAHVDRVVVRDVEQALLEESSRPVTDHAVAFHFAETEATVTRTSLGRLAGQDLSRATATGVDLVADHVLQTLVESRPEEDHDFQSLPSKARIHHLVAVLLVAEIMQHTGHVLDRLAAEGSSIALVTVETDDF